MVDINIAVEFLAHFRAHSNAYFCELSRRFADVRQIFGIPKRGTSVYHRAMSETRSLFLGAEVSDN